MHYNLLFNGCSWTYGTELEGLNKNEEHRITHRFSHLVAKQLNMTHVNISASGESNDGIVEKTIDWFESGNTCDVAIIQFTESCRTTWYDENDNNRRYRIGNFTLKNNKLKNQFFQNKTRDRAHFAASLYYKIFDSPALGHQNFYKNLFFLKKYLVEKNIKYVFLKLSFICELELEVNNYGWKKYCSDIDVIKCGYEMIGHPDTLNSSNINYCKNFANKKYSHLVGVHPSELGHQKIADCIIKHVNL